MKTINQSSFREAEAVVGRKPTSKWVGASLALSIGIGALAGCGAEPDDVTSATGAILPSDLNWTPGLARDAILAGADTNGETLYPCRAVVANAVTPGKIRPSWTACDVSYGGQEIFVSEYQTLIPAWASTSGNNVPSNAFPLGSEPGPLPLFTCRASLGKGTHLGKTRAGFAGCYVPYGGAEVHVANYQVLVNTSKFGVTPQTVAQGAALPANAIRGGTDDDGSILYPCLASYKGGTHPGKTRSGWGTCDISYGGAEIFVPGSYQVLVPQFNAPAFNAGTRLFAAGTDSDGTTLNVCQASYQGSTQVGKYRGGTCYFPFGGQEIGVITGYKVLSNFADASPIFWNWPSITFDNGVAAGGNASLTLNPDGSYVFQGHFHDAGAVAYDDKITLTVPGFNGTLMTFSHSGHIAGTFEPGSRDDNWNTTGTNATIVDEWSDMKLATQMNVLPNQKSSMSLDFGSLLSALETAYTYISKVVAIVASIA